MSFETESYKELQMWEIITRLKKLEGDNLESIVKSGLDKIKSAVKLSVDSAENPYEERYKFDLAYSPRPISPDLFALEARERAMRQMEGMRNSGNPFGGLQGLGQSAASSGVAIGMANSNPSMFGW